MVEANEVAIIFKPIPNEEGILEPVPVDVVEGYYEERDEKFIDINSYSYPHILECETGKSYAFRVPINTLISNYPDKTLNEIKSELLTDAKKNKYKYAMSKKEEEIMILIYNDEYEFPRMLVDVDTKNFLMFISDESDFDFDKDEEELNEEPEEIITMPQKVNFNPHKLLTEIKKVVKGQDDAIKSIIMTIWENQQKNHANNLLLVGSSGCGKTEILRQIEKKLNIPLYIVSCAGFSQAGYVGTGTDTILEGLLAMTKGDVSKAEGAIVVLDEIDKLAYRNDSGQVATEAVQNELLKIVEDGKFAVKVEGNFMGNKTVMLDTSNITFIGIGAFDGMLETTEKKNMGFGNEINKIVKEKDKIEPSDVTKYGFKPELVGRMGKIVKLNKLSLDTLKEIILTSEKSPYMEKIELIKKMGINLSKTKIDEIAEEIALISSKRNIGARAIANVVDDMFSDILFDISNPEEKFSKLEISKDTVIDSKKYVLRKKNERTKRDRKINN